MNRFFRAAPVWLLLLALAMPAFSQGGFFSTVTGTVTDVSKALIPGVGVKATAVDTSVVTSTVTNESGSYTFSNLAPGKYTISASLPGFQTKTFTDVNLSQNTSYRYNFELTVSGVNTQVEVSVSADSVLATSGASVGTVLSQQKVQDLPLVGNNVLNLITVLAGIENTSAMDGAFGREGTTFAGVSAQNVSIVRDGIQVQDNRYPNGIYSVTTINPDLVGEIRLILAPVDVEIGRGNGTIQYSTRSGTNRFSGTAVWSFRNTALDPNSWTNNRNQTVPVGSPAGTLPVATLPNWTNVQQGTVSYGGPIIRNKTFFFALFDFNKNVSRSISNFTLPTACARLGIFRYFNGWNNGNIFTGKNETSATAATYPSVFADGTPVNPKNNGTIAAGGEPPLWSTNNPSTPYDPSLQYISVFGPLASKPTTPDCSDAPINMTTLVPNGVSPSASGTYGQGWDPYRKQLDPTGLISRTLDFYPLPNNFEVGDGLNNAGYKLLRHYTGLDNLFGAGEGTGERKQINVKIDHNFTANHKANVNVTYERVNSDDTVAALPGMFSNLNYRHPVVFSSGFTSTLSSTLLNEARFGARLAGTNVVAPWDRPELQDELNAYFPPDVNGIRVIPTMTSSFNYCSPHSGVRPPGSGCIGLTSTSQDKTPTYTLADTLSWTHGAHGFKFGGELRLNSSDNKSSSPGVFFGTPVFANPSNGNIFGTFTPGIPGTIQTTTANDISNLNPAMTYLLATNSGNARTFANYLAGSLTNVTQSYFLTSASQVDFANLSDPTKNKWSDYRDQQLPNTKFLQREFDAFFKDDYKVTRNLTLHLGVRWDYYGVPYIDGGRTVAPVGGGVAGFGVSGDFAGWMVPGIRAGVTNFEFVGPGSQNPNKTLYPNDYNNFSPGVGFAWAVPWFGEGKTTVNGGYQITYQGGGRFNTLQSALAAPPGSTLAASPAWTNVYKDLTDLTTSIPVTPSVLPMQPLPLIGPRNATFNAFDSNYVSPYVQNLTFSVTRTLNRNVTMDVRYVGTLSRKSYTTMNLNTNNFLYNGLLDELNAVRTGTEITKTAADPKSLLDKAFQNINLCTTGCTALTGGQTYGPIGTTTGSGGTALFQTAALQMRSSGAFQANLANGNYNGIATTISQLNYTNTGSNASLPAITQGTLGGALRYANTVTYPGQFPENFVTTNPQFGTLTLNNNSGYGNYHSLQVQANIRPIQGFSGQVTYAWSKNLGLGTITDPTNRAADYTNINNNPTHSLRTNGTVELPFGPNKLFMGNSSGFLARAIERWQLGLIYNLSSGAPTSISATSMLYGNGVPDIVYPVDFNKMKGVRWGTVNGAFLEGRYLDNNDTFVKVDDPQCGTVTSLQGLNNVVGGVQTRCTLDALAMAVPASTAGAFNTTFADGVVRPAVIVLQQAQPGKKGTLGNNTILGLGSYRFDANLGKTFAISESKSVQVRFDAQNVLNHPQPVAPNLSITDTNYFGRITSKAGNRSFQGQLRFSF